MNSVDEEKLNSSSVPGVPGKDIPEGESNEWRRWGAWEARLGAQLTELARLCAPDATWTPDEDSQTARLQQQASALAQLHDELKEAQRCWLEEQDWARREGHMRAEKLAALQRQLAEQSAELAGRAALLDQRERKLEHAFQFASQQQAEVDAQRLRLRSQRRRIRSALAHRREELLRQLQEFHEARNATEGTQCHTDSQVADLVLERDALRLRLETAEAAMGASCERESAENEKSYELRRRFELAVEDMRAYKHRVEDLEQQLAQRPGNPAPALSSGPGNWAQQKAQMLASLETEMSDSDPKSAEARLTVEGAIRITDDVVAEKEATIKQLQQELEDLRHERKSAAANYADTQTAAVLDHDAVIAAERERLRKLQESSLEKQRAAEVELSVERAKLARQRMELEERLHAMETNLTRRQTANNDGEEPVSAPSRSLRGRWLARLGLFHDDPAD